MSIDSNIATQSEVRGAGISQPAVGERVPGVSDSGSANGVGRVVALCTCSYSVFPEDERTVAYFAVR